MTGRHGHFYLVEGINPVPWSAPSVGGFGSKPVLYKSDELRAYQEAIAEEFITQNPDHEYFDRGTLIHLEFGFWRRLDSYELGEGEKARAHIADATNLQKSTEDALQGVLFHNDRDVRYVSSRIMAQDEATEPAVMIHIAEFSPSGGGHPFQSFRSDILARREVEGGLEPGQPGQQSARIKKWDVEETF